MFNGIFICGDRQVFSVRLQNKLYVKKQIYLISVVLIIRELILSNLDLFNLHLKQRIMSNKYNTKQLGNNKYLIK